MFGKKDSANSFSGVALGDLSKVSDAETTHLETGLLGFHKGVQSYGFRDDGTAFIGKSGAGRIHFDGD